MVSEVSIVSTVGIVSIVSMAIVSIAPEEEPRLLELARAEQPAAAERVGEQAPHG